MSEPPPAPAPAPEPRPPAPETGAAPQAPEPGPPAPAPGPPAPARDAAPPDLLNRLDPDRAHPRPAEPEARPDQSGAVADGPAPEPVIDTRRYRWMIGIFGIVLVIAISIYQFATHGLGTTGVPPGQRLHLFAAPLANTSLTGDPNLTPPCTPARHDRRALNVCLDVQRAPLVLAFFVTGSGECQRSVDALQKLSGGFRLGSVQFAAVAVHSTRAETLALIRSHHWTIPVAYDRDGSVGAQYGVAICPMVELAYRGGTVRDRLIGDRWQSTAALAPHVRALLRSRPPRT